MDIETLYQLKKTILFMNFELDEIKNIFRHISLRITHYKKGEILFLEGSDCTGIGIVLSGKVEINKGATIGKKILITTIHEGDMFAEAIVFTSGHKYPATVEAAEDTKVAFISRQNIISLCSQYPSFIENFMEILSNKIFILNSKLSLLSMKSLRQKIAFYLIKESKPLKSKNELRKFISISKQDLSLELGVERPSLSRELIKMKDEGLLEFEGKKIIVNDIEALGEIIE